MRKIKFLADSGKPVVVEAANGLTVGGLIELLTAKGVELKLERNLLADMDSKAIYAQADAVLPDGDIRLFTTVKDPKGNSERTDAYDKIKAFIGRDGDKAKNHFNKEKNFTNKGTDDLVKMIQKYEAKNGAVKAAKPATNNSSAKAPKKAAPVKKATSSKSEISAEEENEMKAAQRSFNPSVLHTRSRH